MKALHYIPGFGVGGIESLFIEWIKLDVGIQFYLIHESKLTDEIILLLDKYEVIHYEIPACNLKSIFSHISTIYRIIKDTNFDVVHQHTFSRRPVLLFLSKLNRIKKRIIHIHTNSLNFYGAKKIISRVISKFESMMLTEAIACSENAKVYYEKLTNYNKIEVIYNGISPEVFLFSNKYRNELREKNNIRDNQLVFGHVGRLTNAKNQFFMLDLLKKYLEIDIDVLLIIVGDGPLKNDLIEYSKTLSITNNVIFAGSVNSSELFKYYSLMDIFLLPSLYEGFGIAALEAQANGLPTLLSNKISKIVNVNDETIFLPLILDEWIEYIQLININRIVDEEKRLLSNSNIKLSSFAIKTQVNKIKGIYNYDEKN